MKHSIKHVLSGFKKRLARIRRKDLLHPNIVLIVSVILALALPVASFAQIKQPSHYMEDTCAEIVPHCGYVHASPPAYQGKAFAQLVNRALISTHTTTYSIEFRGNITANRAQFQQEVNQTLNDPRGWAQVGTRFMEVSSGGDFRLILIEAALLDSIPGCSSEWSCRSGPQVLINQDRWNHTSTAWQAAGGDLRDYHHMVVNHEVGHWLGHDHPHCSGPGQLAPIMLQQSIDLQGCRFNPWPLPGEIWTNRF